MDFTVATNIYWRFYEYNHQLSELLDIVIEEAPSIAVRFFQDALTDIPVEKIREDFRDYPGSYEISEEELEAFIKAEMSETCESTNKSYIFSKVTITADNDSYTEFLASGIPENEDDLTIYTDYQTLLEDEPDIENITVEVDVYSCGEGEFENADDDLLEELANTNIEDSDEFTLIQSHSFAIYDVHKEEN